MKIIYITGETCQGKTYMAEKLKKRFGWETIATDCAYLYMEEKQPDHKYLWQWLINNQHKKDFYLKQKISDILIIEGVHTCSEKERNFINDIFKPKKHILVKVESSEWEKRKIERWGEQPIKLNDEWFKKNYKPAPITKIVSNYKEAIEFIEGEIL